MKVKTLTPRVSPEEGELIKEAAYRARVSQAVWMRRKLGLPDQPTTAVHTSELYCDVYGPEAACSDPFVSPRQEVIEPQRHEGHEEA